MTGYDDRFYAGFGLMYNPFAKNNADKFRYDNKDCRELRIRLDHLFETKGIGLVVGSPGLGKTSLVREYAGKLNRSLYKVVYISMSTLSECDFIYNMVTMMGYEPTCKKSANIKIIQKAIIDYADNKKMTPVIIFDEANYLSSSFLNDLKMILNFRMDSYDRFVVLLVGLPVLVSNLHVAAQEPLRQRIIMNYTFDGMDKEEVKEYISGKLEKAGGSRNIFDEGAIQAICNITHCNPRLIDNLMTYSLMIAASSHTQWITPEIVEQASLEIMN